MRALAALLCIALAGPAAASYSERAEVKAFIRDMVARHGFVEAELNTLFTRVERADPVLQAILPQSQVMPWRDYRAQFVNEKRIAGGAEFWDAHRGALERAQRLFGVPPEIIVAIIGIETRYGRNTGRHRVVDALTTLAFDYPPRATFFRGELENYLLLARDTGLDVFEVRGSFAGAIGIPQFIPSSARAYAVDFDGNGAIDLRNSPVDAIGSVGNFLRKHGWRRGAPVQIRARTSGDAWRSYVGGFEAKHSLDELVAAGVKPASRSDARVALIDLGSEQRLGLQNFYVLTRYNRSALYAAAVADLAEGLRKQRPQAPPKE